MWLSAIFDSVGHAARHGRIATAAVQCPTMSKCRQPAGNTSQPEGRMAVSPVTPRQQRFPVCHHPPLVVQGGGKRGWPTGKTDGHWRASSAAQTDRAAGWPVGCHHITLDTRCFCVLYSVFCTIVFCILYPVLVSVKGPENIPRHPWPWESGSSGHRPAWSNRQHGNLEGTWKRSMACEACEAWRPRV